MVVAVLNCTLKVNVISIGEICALYKQYFLISCNNPLFNCRNVVYSAVAEGLLFKPAAAECVTFL